jgi:glycosyltransferase involved in cell wall biosynthesis
LDEVGMRVAIVNSSYVGFGGSEKVDDVFGRLFPEADVFALFAKEQYIPSSLQGRRISLSPLQQVPKIDKVYRLFFPCYPSAVESLDLRGYDLVISSDHGAMKGVLCDQDSIHICYCHTPWRQIWDLYRTSLKIVPAPLRPFYALTAQYLREWDYLAAQRVDSFVTNSHNIAHRIKKVYRRDSTVIYPPVETCRGYLSGKTDDYYLSVGRLSHTKRLDIVIEACNRVGRRLLIVGAGREEKRLKALAGPTVEFLGQVSNAELFKLYANCRAFLFAADEDFGIVSVEAQSYGRPVIAYGHGGSLETVRVNDPQGRPDTGILFPAQTADSMADGIRRFELIEDQFIPEEIQKHARQFDTLLFEEHFRAFVDAAIGEKSEIELADTLVGADR